MAPRYDVAIIGGGHNGLVAAAYIAVNWLEPVVLESRDVVGSAAVSEHPFGPGYTVSMLSYVVSLLPPSLVRELGLGKHGYHVYPQGPYFAHGQSAMWGFPRGGMGGNTSAVASAARGFGAEIRTGAPVARITHRGQEPRVTGVVLESGEEIEAPVVVTTAHPAISFLRLLDPAALPADFVEDIRRWKTRSGTVKINCAVDRLPTFTSHPDHDPDVYGGTIELAESLDDIETAFQEAVNGDAAQEPFADICIPSVFDDSLAPPGHHIVSMFTQWVPHTWSEQPHTRELDAYADRVFARMDEVAPGFSDSVVGRVVIGPHRMEHEYGLVGGNIFHGELTPAQLFHARPAAGYADLRTPVLGLYQAGSATHGGGGVTGIPGRNVVRQILHDRRASRWRRRS